MPTLTSVEVHGLLGEFDHHIDFPDPWDFVILYGPNGVGKTKLLESIKSLLSLEVNRLWGAPFRQLSLGFSDGRVLTAEKSLREPTLWGDVPDEALPLEFVSDLRLALTTSGRELASATIPVNRDGEQEFMHWLEASSPWRRVGPDLWEDATDGELLEFVDLRARYHGVHQSATRHEELSEIPALIREFCAGLNSHLIETQRLLTTPKRRPGRSGPSHARALPTVSEYSQDLKRRLNQALAMNSRITQQLDRTFPRRILQLTGSRFVDDQQIRERYVAQNHLRSRLAAIGLIDAQPEFPLPEQALEQWQREVLSTYLDDTDKKLATFDLILNKVQLLEEIVNSRFLRKRIAVNADEGLKIYAAPYDRPLNPESLSSGEQHELILIYDLLFNVPEGATVLIDEPEISLHVAWQQRFLSDLTRVAELSSVRFIIATHSPQIIHKSWRQTVELGAAIGAEWEEE